MEQLEQIKSQKNNYDRVNYNFIDNDFYANADNELTIENLSHLAALAELIEEPNVSGIFNNDDHYLRTLSLVLNSTHETRNRRIFFLKKILPLLATKKRLLDVGPGDCEITKTFLDQFEHFTAVDVNEAILKKLDEIVPKNIDVMTLHGSLLDVNLPSQYFDLSLLSHILYYIDSATWLSTVMRIYESTRSNGLVVIVLGGDNFGKADLISYFGGKTLNIDQLASNCIKTFGASSVQLYASDESFIALTLTGMLHIAGFMLCDAGVTAPKKDLVDYIHRNFWNPAGFFEMTTRQKYILISK